MQPLHLGRRPHSCRCCGPVAATCCLLLLLQKGAKRGRDSPAAAAAGASGGGAASLPKLCLGTTLLEEDEDFAEGVCIATLQVCV
jgi:hypothetical protein